MKDRDEIRQSEVEQKKKKKDVRRIVGGSKGVCEIIYEAMKNNESKRSFQQSEV